MIKRLGLVPGVVAVATLVAVAGLSSCDRFEPNEPAAVVNGLELSLAQLDELAEGNDDPAVRRASLSAWIQVVAVSEEPGEFLTEADLAAQRELVIPPLIEATQDKAQELYELGIDGSPLLCLAVIPLAVETSSAAILDALEDGVSFADLVTEFSDDPTLIETAGVVVIQGQECLPTDQWNAELLEMLAEEEVVVGEAGVIILNDREVIVLLRPFEDLSPTSKSQLAEGPVSEVLLERYRAAEVTVHESIGTWDAEQGLVVAPPSHE